MSGKYTTVLTNNYFSFSDKYVSIQIQANDLDTFVKVVKYCEELEEVKE